MGIRLRMSHSSSHGKYERDPESGFQVLPAMAESAGAIEDEVLRARGCAKLLLDFPLRVQIEGSVCS